MAEQASIAFSRRATAGDRPREAVERLVPFLVGGLDDRAPRRRPRRLLAGLVGLERGSCSRGWRRSGSSSGAGRVSRLELALRRSSGAFTGWTALSLALDLERHADDALGRAHARLRARRRCGRRACSGRRPIARSSGVSGRARAASASTGSLTRLLAGAPRRRRPDRRQPPRGADRLLERPRPPRRDRASCSRVGLAARGRSPAARALAAASLPVIVPTLYLTFSRGAWVALAAAVVVAAVALRPGGSS